MLRPSELTMPVVNVPSRPNGLPIASTFCPTCNPSESPRCSVGSLPRGVNLQQRQIVGFVAAQQLRLVARLIGQRHFELALIGNHVVVGEDLAVRADQETRTLVLGRINLQENCAPIDRAGDVHRGEMRRLVDVDVVRLIRTQAGGVRRRRAGPQRPGAGDRIQNPALSPIGLGGDEKKSAHQQSGNHKNAQFSYC